MAVSFTPQQTIKTLASEGAAAGKSTVATDATVNSFVNVAASSAFQKYFTIVYQVPAGTTADRSCNQLGGTLLLPGD